ncbi:hypothetical protein M728_003644 (plasmid) [Ensifer sp. WSM1721]
MISWQYASKVADEQWSIVGRPLPKPSGTAGGADLTSSTGTMTMNVLNAVAQFERDLLIERTQSGLKRA